MRKFNSLIYLALLAIFMCSCEDYLDKAPDSELGKEDIFQDFQHAQGFVEQCYAHVVNYQANIEWNAAGFLLGDETLPSKEKYKADWFWELGAIDRYMNGANYLYNNKTDDKQKITDDLAMNRGGIWQGWKAIRIANIVLETLNDPKFSANISDDEMKLLKGQAYFFRAFFHSEIMKFWGRIPYVDKVLIDNDVDFRMVRPATYKECALKADADFEKAAELLPEDWKDLEGKIDSRTIHSTTFGNSRRRINKAIVYSFKGRNLLMAASPLMYCSDSNKGIDSYAYDEELAEKAASEFAKVIDMDNRNVLDLELASRNNLLYCFTTKPGQGSYFPGTPEAIGAAECEYIFSSPAQVPWACSMIAQTFMPYGSSNVITPNHRFVHKVFGTANGLACDEDPSHSFQNEFENRDPRFYHNLFIDGDMIIQKASAKPKFKYAECHTRPDTYDKDGNLIGTKGILRGGAVSLYSGGYFIKKWAVLTHNSAQLGNDQIDNQGGQQWWMNMRLTDVYLMYAEALAATAKYGANKNPDFNGVTLSALEVLNKLRDRFSMPHVEVSYQIIDKNVTNDSRLFMDVLRRERSTEMCFEACRWTDIRRWMIAHLEDQTLKTSIEFERDVYSEANAKRGTFKNINFQEKEMIRRVCEYPKHYWLPFNQKDVELYEGFPQNPGW